MNSLDDMPFGEAADDWPPAVEREPRPCLHPKYRRVADGNGGWTCECGHAASRVTTRRGRTSLRAGKDAERAIAKSYGGTRTGQFGGPDDVVVGELFVVQSKAGGWFSNRYWAELVKLPRTAGRIPTLIVSDRPGPGHRVRRLVIRMIDDDLDLHGEATNAPKG